MRAKKYSTPITLGAASAAVLMGLVAGTAQAGRITGAIGDAGDLDGWDTTNVVVKIDGTDASSTSYDPSVFPANTMGTDSYESFVSEIYDGAPGSSTLMGSLIGKDFPIGAPPGLKIVNGTTNTVFNNGRPTNCIMTTSYLEGGYLDDATPLPNSCDGPPQSHKRFKFNMTADSVYDPNADVTAVDLATVTNAVLGGGIDLVFNVEAGENRDYQVFQKINNHTGMRLQGYVIQVGTGVGSTFTPITDTSIIGLDVPYSAWDDQTQMANFAFGLFGDAATNPHHTEDGFFDNTDRAALDARLVVAGPTVLTEAERATNTSLAYRIVAGDALPSNYTTLPVTDGLTPQVTDDPNQFGEWMHTGQLPYGIFFDDDNDPETDAQLVAFYGVSNYDSSTPANSTVEWMRGDADNFASVDPVAQGWFANPAYSVGPIEDLVNLGLNYIVSVGDVSTLGGTFTLRVTPVAAADQTDPAYVGNDPAYTVSDGTVVIGPNPVEAGGTLYIRANDGDVTSGPVTVTVTNTTTGEKENVSLDLVFSGVVQGTIPTSTDAGTNTGTVPAAGDGVLYVAAGDVIQVDYVDPTNSNDTATATTTVAVPVVPTSDGGCSIGSADGKGDWTLPALLAAMLGFGLMRRRRSQAFKA